MAFFGLMLFALAGVPASADAASSKGALRVTVAGLPAGQAAKVTVRRSGQKTRAVRRTTTLRGLVAGKWVITVEAVRLRRASGGAKAGARVLPGPSGVTVTVKRRRTARGTVSYGTVINPGVRKPPATKAVIGNPGRPDGLLVAAGSAPPVGTYLAGGPTEALPYGLVARVAAVRSVSGGQEVRLEHVAATEVAPVIVYDGALSGVRGATRLRIFGATAEFKLRDGDCGVASGFDITPIFSIGSPRVQADIRSTPWGGGPKAELTISSRPSVGARVETSDGVFCEKELAAPTTIVGFIPVGPVAVPVYLAVPLSFRAELAAKTTASASVSWDMRVGMRTRRAGLALVPAPVFEASNPSSDINVSTTPQVKIGPSLGAELGLGVRSAISLHVEASTAVEFSARPGQCSWDWRLGSFTAVATAGPLKLKTPEIGTTSHRLWTGCGRSTFTPTPPATGGEDGGGGTSPPPVPPQPPGRPPPPGPPPPPASGFMVGTPGTGGASSSSLALAPNGDIVGAPCGDFEQPPYRLFALAPDGSVHWAASTDGSPVRGLCSQAPTIDRDGNVYVEQGDLTSHSGPWNLTAYTSSGIKRWSIPVPRNPGGNLIGSPMTVGADGRVYRASTTSGPGSPRVEIRAYDPSSGQSTTVAQTAPGEFPEFINAYTNGLAVVDSGSKTVGGQLQPVVRWYGYDGTLRTTYWPKDTFPDLGMWPGGGVHGVEAGPEGQVVLTLFSGGGECGNTSLTALRVASDGSLLTTYRKTGVCGAAPAMPHPQGGVVVLTHNTSDPPQAPTLTSVAANGTVRFSRTAGSSAFDSWGSSSASGVNLRVTSAGESVVVQAGVRYSTNCNGGDAGHTTVSFYAADGTVARNPIELFPPCDPPNSLQYGFTGGTGRRMTVSPGRLILGGWSLPIPRDPPGSSSYGESSTYAIRSMLVSGLGSDYEAIQHGT